MKEQSPEKQLAGFIAKYTPEVAGVAHAALAKMRNAEFVTGDPEFKSVEKEIKINWLAK